MTIQFSRYAVVGLATYVLFILLSSILVFLTLDSSMSIVIAFALVTFFHYVMSAKWIYVESDLREPLFGWKSARYLFAVALNLILILVVNRVLVMYTKSEFLSLVLAPAFSTIFNFFLMKKVVFRKTVS